MVYETFGLHLGAFDLHGSKVFGELNLATDQTHLKLFTTASLPSLDVPSVVSGELHDFTCVTCIDCVGGDAPTTSWDSKGNNSFSWKLFPHFTLMGQRHFDPANDRITAVWLSVTDGPLIFDDFDAYGIVSDMSNAASELIPKSIGDRPVPHGSRPKLAYFAGRCDLLEASIPEGSIELQHWPIFPRNTAEGIRLESKLKIGLRFITPTELAVGIFSVNRLAQFLSLVAGRSQGVTDIQVHVNGAGDKEVPLLLHWSLGPSAGNPTEEDKPSWRDMPLDAIRRPDEFARVLSAWWDTSTQHHVARHRLYECRDKANFFDTDRLIAAANMFDLRPTSVVADIPADLAQVCNDSVIALKKLPNTDDRNSAIQALKRIGEPSLRKKILARAGIVKGHFPLDDLDDVLRVAVQCRNYFVHGGGDDKFSYAAVEPFTTFLTETLEFVFAAAELIECGWNGRSWRTRSHTAGHWFSRYVHSYSADARQLLLACKKAPRA